MTGNFDLLDFTGFCFQKKIAPSRTAFENWYRRTFHQKTKSAQEESICSFLVLAEDLLMEIGCPLEDCEAAINPSALFLA